MPALRLPAAPRHRVLLIKCSRDVQPGDRPGPRSFPLGIMYLSSVLKQRGRHPVETRLVQVEMLSDRKADLARIVDEFRPHVVGLSAVTGEARNASDIAAFVKALDPAPVTILGGPHATTYPHAAKDPHIDLVVRSEGERTLLELMDWLVTSGEESTLSRVAGVAYKEGLQPRTEGVAPRVVFTGARKLMEDLDDLPFPDWDGIDIDVYQPWGNFANMVPTGRRYGSMYTSRGCPYQCIFCHDVFGKKTHYRTPDSILAEMRWLRERYGIDDIQFVDDIFNLSRTRMAAWLDRLEAEEAGAFRFNFPNGLRTDLLTADELRRLRANGCYYISFAIESGNERVRELIQKRLDLKKVVRNLEVSDDLGIINSAFFMIGFPGETKEEILDTLRVAALPTIDVPNIFVTIPHYGTPLFELAVRQGYIPEANDFDQFHYTLTGTNCSTVPEEEFAKLRDIATQIVGVPSRKAKLHAKMADFGLTRPLMPAAGAHPEDAPAPQRGSGEIRLPLPDDGLALPTGLSSAVDRMIQRGVHFGGYSLRLVDLARAELQVDLFRGDDWVRVRISADRSQSEDPFWRTAHADVTVKPPKGSRRILPRHEMPLKMLCQRLAEIDGPYRG